VTRDELRSARLLFAEELAGGRVSEADISRPEVEDAVTFRPVPSPLSRYVQRVLMKRGRLTYEGECVEPLAAARSAVLGADAAGPPRFLVRVDEFPHRYALDEPERVGTAAYRRFHAVLRDAGLPYLVAVLPALAHDPLNPDGSGERELTEEEIELLDELAADGVAFAQHGYNHRTRSAKQNRYSELSSLSPTELTELLDRGAEVLARARVRTPVFTPPFNRFDPAQYELLAERFELVCGGPESVARFGFHRTPLWRGEAVYMPAYDPLYGPSKSVRPAAERLVERRTALWVPICLHWAREAEDDFEELRRLAGSIASHSLRWDDFLDSAQRTR
jgi:hypothetical protein